MKESLGTRVDASPTVVLERLTHVARLPEWNDAITEVLEEPAALTPGSVWKVRLHALGQSWVSKSTLVELDTTDGRFRHRSQSDDGNPSYADSEWLVQPDGTGKYLLIHVRRPGLRKEMQASLAALATTVSA